MAHAGWTTGPPHPVGCAHVLHHAEVIRQALRDAEGAAFSHPWAQDAGCAAALPQSSVYSDLYFLSPSSPWGPEQC